MALSAGLAAHVGKLLHQLADLLELLEQLVDLLHRGTASDGDALLAAGVEHPAEVKLDADKAKDWLSKGAQPTETVKSLFKKNGILA